nr:hypothetical protein [uncultured Mediterraneibacter sp.]
MQYEEKKTYRRAHIYGMGIDFGKVEQIDYCCSNFTKSHYICVLEKEMVLMETKLARISQLSKENPDMVFTSLGHLINKEMLESCHVQMDGTKAVGIDGITKEEYGRNLEENINTLIEELKKKSYKPKPARLVEIPKDNWKDASTQYLLLRR